MRHQAIYNTHPNVASIRAEVPLDIDGNPVQVDEILIQNELSKIQAAEPMRLLRLERDARIAKTDWRATVDYPGTDQEVWLTYRQALRDLPATAEPELNENGMLTNVTWPEEPV